MGAGGTHDALRRVLAEAARRGFLGPGPVEAHLVHAEGFAGAVAQWLPPAGSMRERAPTDAGAISPVAATGVFCDLGSGGGLPGLPLLAWRPDLHGVLLDAQRRRTRFLEEAVRELGLEARATILTGRAEDLLADRDLALDGRFHAVVARSFGPPSATVEIAAQLVVPGGIVLISEPPEPRRWAGIERLGMVRHEVTEATVAVFERVGEPPVLRRWKAMVDRPAVIVTPGPAPSPTGRE